MMRRPNRSIEVFDISLMAVVTKAMGAFLVIMLLLMPYYSSGPVGEKNAEDLAKKLEQTQSQLSDVLKKLGQYTEDPRELRRLLEEARRRLTEAQALAARLKRDNDALNSQVKRLEARLDDVRHQLAQAKDELRKRRALLASVQLINSDCSDVRLGAALLSKDATATIDRNTAKDSKDESKGKDGNSESKGNEGKKSERPNKQEEAKRSEPVKLKYVLNHANLSMGNEIVATDDEIVAKVYDGKTSVRPGQEWRFNSYATTYPMENESETLMIVLTSRSKRYEKFKSGDEGYALQKTSKPCHVLVNTQTYDPVTGWFRAFYPFDRVIPAKTYALVLYDMVLRKDKNGDRDLRQIIPSAESKAWLEDQIAHAVKVEDRPPPEKKVEPPAKKFIPPQKHAPDNRPKITKQQVLATIDSFPVPKDRNRCMFLMGQVMKLESWLNVLGDQSQKGINEIQGACMQGQYAEALSKAKSELRRAAK